MTLKEKGKSTTLTTKISRTSKPLNTSTTVNAQATRMNNAGETAATNVAGGTSNSKSEISLPRLKSSGIVLFVTKAVCLQRKEELDRYLQELFNGAAALSHDLGPMITHSRLVAEFFGIWKTDMGAHFRQEVHTPFAVQAASSTTRATVNRTGAAATITTFTAAPVIPLTSESSKDQIKEEDKEEEEKENKMSMVLSTDNRNRSPRPFPHIHPTVERSSPSSHSISDDEEDDSILEISASSFPAVPTSIPSASVFSSHSCSSSTLVNIERPQNQLQNTNPIMTLPHLSRYNTSSSLVALSPKHLKNDSLRSSSGWSLELAAQLIGATPQQQQQQQQQRQYQPLRPSAVGDIMDSAMASPTEETSCAVIGNNLAQLAATTVVPVAAGSHGCKTVSTSSMEPVVDNTTRTIKKNKSLRCIDTSNPSRTPHQQQQEANMLVDTQNRDELRPTPEGLKSGSDSATTHGITLPSLCSTATPSSPSAQAPRPPQAGLPKSKLMKRSKTIVFRPESKDS
ncbi:hypothetical protein BGZ65_004084 [Modicella reniformis]|uniref:PX domain-containing protein n=1 Tax=Modicella reniformis TaxID=1440133 RepID=A0A9P6IKE5_9FUNG|nr:hypothetical protein BGZ65_004084 [Modicella reniformis]